MKKLRCYFCGATATPKEAGLARWEIVVLIPRAKDGSVAWPNNAREHQIDEAGGFDACASCSSLVDHEKLWGDAPGTLPAEDRGEAELLFESE